MPETLRQYTILAPIGAGRMGEVLRALDTRIGRTVAIRRLPREISDNETLRKRLLAEAERAAALSHANVAGLVEYGEEDDRIFLVFEHVEGDKLSAVIAGRPMNVRRAVDFAIQLADALAEAHGLGIVHGDLKPDNIIVTPKGRPRILDFGFVRWTGGGAAREAAAAGLPITGTALLGTVPYLSPEQALGEAGDGRSDIFSLGTILFEMLTGRPPFQAPDALGVLVQILRAQPGDPGALNPQVPPALDACVARALAKSLAARYPSAAVFATELRQVAADMDARTEEVSAARAVRPPRARSVVLRMAVLALVVAAGAGWIWRDGLRTAVRRWSRPVRPPVLALVPFVVDGDASRQYLGEGLAEDVAVRLGQIPGVAVVGRSSIPAARGRAPAEVGREVGAALVVGGRASIDHATVDLAASLTDVETGREIWSGRFTRKTTNVVALQAEVAQTLARAIGVAVPPGASRDRTALRVVDAGAYDLYLQAREADARRDRRRALALLQEAVAMDADLAEAQAALARALVAERDITGDPNRAPEAAIAQAAGAAVAADPDLPGAQLAMGLAEPLQADTLACFRRAVELDPSCALGYSFIGSELAGLDADLATAFYRKALELDPRFAQAYRERAGAWTALDRFDAALSDLDRGQILDPAGWWWRGLQARVEFSRRRFATGIDLAAGDPALEEWAPLVVAYAGALQVAGQRQEAAATLARFRARYPDACGPAALAVALDFDAGLERDARDAAKRLIAAASAPGAPVMLYPCAAMAAAAVGDGAGTAAWLRHIAENDAALHAWVRQSHGASAEAALLRGWYPWSKVASHPDVIAALSDLDRGRARLRASVAKLLDGLPASSR